MAIIFQTHLLTKRYPGDIEIQYPDLRISKGDFVRIEGKNGSGKTTLLKILSGVISQYEGEVVKDVAPLSLAFVPQLGGLVPTLTVDQNILLKRMLYQKNKLDSNSLLIEHFRMGKFRKKRVRELSGGYQKLTSILSALIVDPDILLLDEPYSGLHQDYQVKLTNVFKALKKTGKTMIACSHLSFDEDIFSQTIDIG